MFNTIQEVEYYIRIVFGDLEITINGSKEDRSFQRILQSNRSGPIAWVAKNTLMVNVHRKKGFRVKLITAITKETKYIVDFIFIDDTNLEEGN